MSAVPPPPPPPPPEGAAQIHHALQTLGGAFVLLGNAILSIDASKGGVLPDPGVAAAVVKGKKRKVAAPQGTRPATGAPAPHSGNCRLCAHAFQNAYLPSARRQVKDKADRKPRAPSAYNNFVKAEGSKLQAEGKTQQVCREAVSRCGLARWFSHSCPPIVASQHFGFRM